MKLKRITALVLAALCAFALASCGTASTTGTTGTTGGTSTPNTDPANVYVISGPTGVGAVSMMEKSAAGETEGKYNFVLAENQLKAQAAFLNGEADIVAMPTNMASALLNKGEDVVILAVNTLGVLYIMDSTGTVKNISDLAGKTITATGQGSNPEYILQYVLEENGVENVTINFMDDAAAISAGMVNGSIEIAMLPQPVATATVVQGKNAGKTIAPVIDMNAEWEKIAEGTESALMMGCVVTTNAYLSANKEKVDLFLKEYKASIEAVLADVETAATLCEKHGIIAKAAIAKQAIPKCNITFATGASMKASLTGYFTVLHAANPASIGGKMPADSLFYMGYEG
ncbi:MAG: ABC transporter substrate-binding protein [Clostridia bacterium]|nr:ABC transporter substrate-binding protein [Clostridia bacterium]